MANARMTVATSYLNCPTGASASACSSFLSNSQTCRAQEEGLALKPLSNPLCALPALPSARLLIMQPNG